MGCQTGGAGWPRRAVSLAERIEDEFRFFKTWATSPLKMGAVSPTSRALARLMVEHANPDPTGYTLELGPGTGVVTEALIEAGIPAGRIVSIEYDRDFCRCSRSASRKRASSSTATHSTSMRRSASSAT